MAKPYARIGAVEVGQRFGHQGTVTVDGVVVHWTDPVGYGSQDVAKRFAAQWAADHGYEVDPVYLDPPIDLLNKPVTTPGKIAIRGVANPWARRS